MTGGYPALSHDPDPTQGEVAPAGEPEATDLSLLRRIQQGQGDASTELYHRYAERLQALAAAQSGADLGPRLDPEDLVQSVFRTFFRRAGLGHYTVPEGEEIWKLLLVIALNKVRATGAFHRAVKRDVRRTTGGAAFDQAVAGRSTPDEAPVQFLRMVIAEQLEGWPESHRRMIEMRIEGHEMAEIAAAVARSKRSVERVLQEFQQRLGRVIGESQ